MFIELQDAEMSRLVDTYEKQLEDQQNRNRNQTFLHTDEAFNFHTRHRIIQIIVFFIVCYYVGIQMHWVNRI